MTRDGVSQTRPQHHELLLPLVLRRSNSPANGIVEAAQLAFGSRVHIAHAADHAVRLIVEIQRIGDQFLDVDLRRTFEAPAIPPTPIVTSVVTALPAATFTATVRTAPALAISLPWATFAALSSTFAALSLRTSATLRTIPWWTIALRPWFPFRALRGRGLHCSGCGLRFSSAWFLLNLGSISHPNLCIVR
jgi:hypothetical protein